MDTQTSNMQRRLMFYCSSISEIQYLFRKAKGTSLFYSDSASVNPSTLRLIKLVILPGGLSQQHSHASKFCLPGEIYSSFRGHITLNTCDQVLQAGNQPPNIDQINSGLLSTQRQAMKTGSKTEQKYCQLLTKAFIMYVLVFDKVMTYCLTIKGKQD